MSGENEKGNSRSCFLKSSCVNRRAVVSGYGRDVRASSAFKTVDDLSAEEVVIVIEDATGGFGEVSTVVILGVVEEGRVVVASVVVKIVVDSVVGWGVVVVDALVVETSVVVEGVVVISVVVVGGVVVVFRVVVVGTGVVVVAISVVTSVVMAFSVVVSSTVKVALDKNPSPCLTVSIGARKGDNSLSEICFPPKRPLINLSPAITVASDMGTDGTE